MSVFDLLMLANLILALVALYQLRICTLILCGNSCLIARGLDSIDRYGPPVSQWFIPASVFSSENLSTAATILTISLVSVVVFTIYSARKRIRIGPQAPVVPKSILILIGIYFVAYMASTATILTGGYTDNFSRSIRYDLELAGAHTLICSVLVYELSRRRLLALITARRAFLILFVVFFFTHYLKGSTGITTGYLLTAAILLLPRTGSAKRLTNVARVSSVLLVILVMSFVVRSIREAFSEEGWGSIEKVVDDVRNSDETIEETSEGLETTANATQSATHILECISLYDYGISRDWRSIYNVFEYTFVPSFFERWFGWSRSIDSRLELFEYYIHGGGINVLGEFYWNGGWLCVVIMSTVLSFFCFLVDKKYRSSPFWLMMMAQFAPSFLMGYGYGFAQISRGAINSLIVTGIYMVVASLQQTYHTPPVVHTSSLSTGTQWT